MKKHILKRMITAQVLAMTLIVTPVIGIQAAEVPAVLTEQEPAAEAAPIEITEISEEISEEILAEAAAEEITVSESAEPAAEAAPAEEAEPAAEAAPAEEAEPAAEAAPAEEAEPAAEAAPVEEAEPAAEAAPAEEAEPAAEAAPVEEAEPAAEPVPAQTEEIVPVDAAAQEPAAEPVEESAAAETEVAEEADAAEETEIVPADPQEVDLEADLYDALNPEEISGAAEIPKNGSIYTGKIGGDGYVWLKFTTPDMTTKYTVVMKNVDISSYTTFSMYEPESEHKEIRALDTQDQLAKGASKSWTTERTLVKNKTYYIRVNSGGKKTGSFQIQLYTQGANRYVDDAVPLYDKQTYSQTINSETKADWYKITTGNSEDYYSVYLRNIGAEFLYFNFYYRTSEGALTDKVIKADTEKINKSQEVTKTTNVKLKKNSTYYLKIFTGGAVGQYEVRINNTGNNGSSDGSGGNTGGGTAGVTNNTKEKAEAIALGYTYERTMANGASTAWYKFTTKKVDSEYTVKAVNVSINGNLQYEIFDVFGNRAVKSGTASRTSAIETKYIDNLWPNQTFYLKVTTSVSTGGNFAFSISPALPFDDVSTQSYYYDAVKWAVDKGVAYGETATWFGSNNACSRGQIVTFLWRAAGSPNPTSSRMPFTDVPYDKYYSKAVIWAYHKGIVAGTSATKFSPDAPCTREQIVSFLWRTAGKPAQTGKSAFKDVPATAYYAQAVTWAEKNGITYGETKTRFGTGHACTRAQVTSFIYRYYVK